MDSYIQMFKIVQKGDKKNSPVEDGIIHQYRTPDKMYCPERRRLVRKSKPPIAEGDNTDPRTLRFEEFKVSAEDTELMLGAAIQHATPILDRLYLESLLRTQSLLDRMTPQKVKYQRSKKRRL